MNLLSSEVQSRLEGTCLFYPCSGGDVAKPIALFHPCIKSFVFADLGYFRERNSVHRERPVLERAHGFELLATEVREDLVPESDWIHDPKYQGVAPCLRSERYRCTKTGEEIVVQRQRRRGPRALRDLQEPLGVFFYRRDSLGDGGSGTLWLTVAPGVTNLVEMIVDRLVEGGLIATDGSNCLRRWRHRPNIYSFFSEVAEAWSDDPSKWRDYQVSDGKGRRFQLLGRIPPGRGRPTLLWQVNRELP